MGKFDGMLLCTDLDDTILTTDKRISDKNIEAAKYFMAEGGKFTFATGRVPEGVKLILKYIVPNAPMVCFNGAGIYDIEKETELWSASLDEDAKKVVEYVEKRCPSLGIAVCTSDETYFSKKNKITQEHQMIERLKDNDVYYTDIPHTWRKVIFMVEKEEIPVIKNIISNSEYKDKYTYVQSSPWYYEVLPKGNTKGTGMLRLAEILKIDIKNVIGMGDNENDLDLVKKAGLGIAVANASEAVRAAADKITVDHNSHALADVIYNIL